MSSMILSSLTRPHGRKPPAVSLAPGIDLVTSRLHEACGPARRSFALWLAGQRTGPVIWIALAHQQDHPNPDGMVAFADPARFVFLAPRRVDDALWCMEEVLRAGIVPLVVADLPVLPGLTPVRRLHLAAETGAATTGSGSNAPIGLLLTPENGGAQGVESRWHMSPTHLPHQDRWRLERRRARTSPPANWLLTREDGTAGLRAAACPT